MEQVIFGGNVEYALDTTNTRYNTLHSGYSWITDEMRAWQLISTDGVIKQLRVVLIGAPGAGKKYTFTLFLNGNPTALTFDIADAATSGSNMADEIVVTSGDTVTIECVPDNSPTARGADWTSVFEGDNANESLILGRASNTLHRTNTYYGQVMTSGTSLSANENDRRQIIPTSGKIKNFYVKLNIDPGTPPDTYKLTVRLNGATVAQSPIVSIVANATTGSDLVHELAVVAGDYITMKTEPLNTPSMWPYVCWGLTFEADVDGESIVIGGSLQGLDRWNTKYQKPSFTESGGWHTEALRHLLGQVCTVKKFHMLLTAPPGAGKKWDFNLRIAGADSNVLFTIAEAATTGDSGALEDTVALDEIVSLRCDPTDVPDAADAYWGFVSYITPPVPSGSEDLLGKFEVGQGSAELLAKAEVQQSGSAELLGKFEAQATAELLAKAEVQQSGSAELLGNGIIRHSDTAELFGKFEAQATAELLAKAEVQRSGSAELLCKSEVQQLGSSELLGKVEVRGLDFAELLGNGIIRHSDTAELLGKGIIRDVGSAKLLGGAVIRHVGTPVELLGKADVQQSDSAELLGKAEIQQSGSVELLGRFEAQAIVELLGKAKVQQSDSAELLGKAEIQQSGSAELLGRFEAQAIVELLGIAEVQQSGSAELFGKVEVQQSGSAEFLGKAEIQQSGSVELLGKAEVRHPGSVELLGRFEAQVSAELLSRATIRHLGSAELLGNAIIRHVGTPVEFLGKADVQQSGFAEFLGELVVRHEGSRDLLGELVVRHEASIDLHAAFESQATVDLFDKFIVRQPATINLPGEFTIKHSAELDLLAKFEVTHSKRLLAKLWIRHPSRLWTNRRYINGVVEIDETELDDTLLEYVIEGVMNDIRSQLISEAMLIYGSWTDITKTPKLIRRATTYGTVANLYSRDINDPNRRIVMGLRPIRLRAVEVRSAQERAMEYWESRMEKMMSLYLTSGGRRLIIVDTEDEEAVFSLEDIPFYSEDPYRIKVR